MDTQRELLAGTTWPAHPVRTPAPDQPVPVLRFLAGTCLAVVAVLRFCREVARESTIDPIHLTPRTLNS